MAATSAPSTSTAATTQALASHSATPESLTNPAATRELLTKRHPKRQLYILLAEIANNPKQPRRDLTKQKKQTWTVTITDSPYKQELQKSRMSTKETHYKRRNKYVGKRGQSWEKRHGQSYSGNEHEGLIKDKTSGKDIQIT